MILSKINAIVEPLLVIIAIHLQPIIGVMSGIAALIYYVSMLKLNVVDKKYGGRWKEYFKSILKLKK